MEKVLLVNEIVKEKGDWLFMQLIPESGETMSEFCQRLSQLLSSYDRQLVKVTCFGDLVNQPACELELTSAFGQQFPLTWIEGETCTDSFMNGMQVWAFKGQLEYFQAKGDVKGCYFEDEQGSYLFTGDLLSAPAQNPEEGYADLLGQINSVLNEKGFTFNDIVRTWYYLDDILSWYDAFNRVRTHFFKQYGVFEKLVPASTGVSGKNKRGTAVTMELLAFRPKVETVDLKQVQSPLQNEAGEYGSSFSRAIRIGTDAYQWMTISGTASILPSGETANIGDVQKQIAHSFEVIGQMVKNEGYSFNDITRATAYLKDHSSYELLQSFLNENPEYQVPLVVTQNIICRDDLLFEVEMDLLK